MLNTQSLCSAPRDPLGQTRCWGSDWRILAWDMLLVFLLRGWAWSIGALPPGSSSWSPGGREFVHAFWRLAKKGVRSLILKELLPKYVSGKYNSYALSLILLMTWKGPSPRGRSLVFLWVGKRSFLKWSQTQSPCSKINALHPFLACSTYLLTFLSIWGLI